MIRPHRLFDFIRNGSTKAYTMFVKRRFKRLESNLSPFVEVKNPEYITIKERTTIRPYTWLYAIVNTGNKKNVFHPDLQIGKSCSIGRFCHITCSNKVVFEDNVFLTEGVLVTDSIHGYKDINTPIYNQPLISLGPVIIGEGTWIGNGARIVGRVKIGTGCIIATNSVVSNSIVPDHCLVSGNPARITKIYNKNLSDWEVVDLPLEKYIK
ncbi:MAG: hypothetical protein DHS20C18_24640 [Saprospiraceae bacterium]|nr:MAG: hypothetical protein DHS20C18_24640 [Saprospiraceae bacterium]